MELNKMRSDLKMDNLYFRSCSVEREREVKNGECKANLQRKIIKICEHEYNVELHYQYKNLIYRFQLLQKRILSMKQKRMKKKRT